MLILFLAKTSASAQRIAITNNVLEDVILTPNFGVEIVVSDRQSLSFDASVAPYKFSQNLYNKCLTLRAGYKYWFNQAFYAHYIGIDAIASSTDVRLREINYRSEYVGLGIGYGYSFLLGSRLNLVPHFGVGLAYGNSYEGYDQMLGPSHGETAVATSSLRPIITRLGLTIQYVLR